MNTVCGNRRLYAVLCRRKHFQVIVALVVVIGVVTAIVISGCTAAPTPEVVEVIVTTEDTASPGVAEEVVVEVTIEPPLPPTPVGCEVDKATMATCQDNELYSNWPGKTEFGPDDKVCIVWRERNCANPDIRIKVYPSGSNEPIMTPTLQAAFSTQPMWNMATLGITLCPGAYETQFSTDNTPPIKWSISRPPITRCADVNTVDVTRVITFNVGQQFQSLALGPDGEKLAVGYADGSIILWDVTSQSVSGSLKGHEEAVTDLAFSPDGKRLVSASDNALMLWDVDGGGSIGAPLEHEGQVRSVVFHLDGEKLAFVDASGRVSLCYIDGGCEVPTQPDQSVDAKQWYIAYAPSGTTLLILYSSERNIDVYVDPNLGEANQSISHSYYHVTSMTLRPDWKMFVSGDSCGYIHLWDFTSVAAPLLCQLELGSTEPVASLSLSFNNQWLAAGNAKGDVFVWEIAWP